MNQGAPALAGIENRRLRPALFLLIAIFLTTCAHHYKFPIQQMRMPPGGLNPDRVPQFVVIGNDDVGYAEGIQYLTNLYASHWNPTGLGNDLTFDGKPLHYSFYVNTIYITPKGVEDPNVVKGAWLDAIQHGHEIGVHTHSHPHGRNFSVSQWQQEMQLCIDHLVDPQGLALSRSQLLGFRTPFTEYNDNTLVAVQKERFTYDCSIEEGFQENEDGRNYIWPYKLDHGSPGNSALYERLDLPLIQKHPGLWEIPHYAFIVPPDDQCEKYGVSPGLRGRILQRNKDFEPETGKITGFDWNLWFEFGMDKSEYLATLKYSLDQRLVGNRCPFTFGTHSDIYTDQSPEKPPQTTPQERRDALREFVEYALSKPQVRVINAKELLQWLQSPVGFSDASTAGALPAKANTSPGLGAGFRYMSFNPKVPPDPKYWLNVGKEMANRFPGAKPEGVWIVSKVKIQEKGGSQLSFPITGQKDPLISGNDQDLNEAALKEFDRLGYRIWLQIEPGFASVEELLDIVLKRYGHHSCVVGVGIDVEWFRSVNPDGGDPVTDDLARSWLAVARSHNPAFRLFVKHWLVEKMPPTVRDGLLFVDDSQIFPAMDPMIEEFAKWGKAFAPSPVAFQIGYPSDHPWWSKLKDPPKEIGTRILQAVPNTEAIFWVDFSVTEVFPR
jgi:hypothetical protein